MLFIYLYRGDLYSDLWKVTCILDLPLDLRSLLEATFCPISDYTWSSHPVTQVTPPWSPKSH